MLVGDQKQLGPTYSFKVEGPTSLYARLIQAGHPFDFLDIQYRMHRSLMEVPNLLFYENRIRCGYVPNQDRRFMFSDSPFLFIDVPHGVEAKKGTSYFNMSEVDVIVGLKDLCLEAFERSKILQKQNPTRPMMKFTKNDIYVITPYNAQKNAIAEYFAESEIDDQVISIDSSQGREFDLVFVSMVRTTPGMFV